MQLDLASLADLTLNKFPNDIPSDSIGPILPTADDPKFSSNFDDAASLNTRNEYWSISSYRTKSHKSEQDVNESVDEIISPHDKSGDFSLPLESLLKPIKKNTYDPINQESVQKFLDGATWEAEPSVEPNETLWTAKTLPLQSVEQPVGVLLGSSIVAEAPITRQRDRFLESIEASSNNQGVVLASGRNTLRRSRLQRYPGSETVYTEYMREDVTGEGEHRVFIQRISTQSTNPPEWYLRHRRQESQPQQETGASEESIAAVPELQPVTHRVLSFTFEFNVGLCRVLRDLSFKRVSSIDAFVGT